MTIGDLLSNETERRRRFPVAAERIFLAHAGVCPLPAAVAEAMASTARQGTSHDQEHGMFPALIQDTRALAAQLLAVDPEEVALIGPTSLGLSFVASGFPWEPGDHVVCYQDDYPSNVYPWTALRDLGVSVGHVPVNSLGEITVEQVIDAVTEDTRLVALASCHFISGYRIDINAIGQALHERGIAFCVDGIQTIGAFPTPLEHVDFMATDAHKWMLGPCAAGLLYVAKNWHERLRPSTYGWNNVRCPDFIAQEELQLRRGAHRYEAGSYSLVGLSGLKAAMQATLDLGIDAIAQELTRKRGFLVRSLREKGYQVLHPSTHHPASGGITSFYRESADLRALAADLESRGITISLRTDRNRRDYLRISPHFYNSDEELTRLLEAL